MRRIELIQGVEQIVQALKTSNLLEVIKSFLDEGRSKEKNTRPTSVLLKALKDYSISAHTFNSAAIEISKTLNLSVLEDANLWSSLMAPSGRDRLMPDLYDIVRFAIRHLPLIISLVKQEPFRLLDQSPDAKQSKFKDKDILSIIVIEEKNRFSSPARLAEVLDSINLLYEVCAILANQKPESLSVIACDSGSDKSFDFLGVAKVIECVKEVILSLWDRVVFFREKQLSHRIELIANALPIIDQIGSLEKDNKLGPEQAEILRRKVIDGVGKFLESGAIIPEISDRASFDPRLLMAPEQKLLSSGTIEVSSETGETHQDAIKEEQVKESEQFNLSNLDPDEQAELLRLLKKTNIDERSIPPENNEPS